MPLDPQAARVVAELPTELWCSPRAIESLTAQAAREGTGGISEEGVLDTSLPAGISIEEIENPLVPRMRAYRPESESIEGVFVWYQGGGFVSGPPTPDPLVAALALASRHVVVTVEYRLAPEHRFPAAPEDCFAALRWVGDNLDRFGDVGPQVPIGGESAGGNLAAVVAMLAQSRGGPEIPLQVLLYPMTARSYDGPSRRDPAIGVAACPEAIDWLWQNYLGDSDLVDALALPLCAESFAGLPPAIVITAEYDVLRDEGEAYAQALEQDGVSVQMSRYEGMFHGFASFPGVIDAADRCIGQMAGAVRRSQRTSRLTD